MYSKNNKRLYKMIFSFFFLLHRIFTAISSELRDIFVNETSMKKF